MARKVILGLLFSTLLYSQAVVGGGSGSPGLNIVAKFDATAQVANIGTTTLYTVPANGGGTYRFSCYVTLTVVATTSTLPQCALFWTDLDSSAAVSVGVSTSSTANTLGMNSTIIGPSGQSVQPWFNAKGGTTIQYATNSYASTGTPMQYAIHIKLEYIGP